MTLNVVMSMECQSFETRLIMLTDEQLTMESFLLVVDACLKELGFKMGSRLRLLRWIQEKSSHIEPGPSSASTGVSTPQLIPMQVSAQAATHESDGTVQVSRFRDYLIIWIKKLIKR